MTQDIVVSVVIPTCGRAAMLERAIRSVGSAARAAGASARCEIVVADDGHEDATQRAVSRLQQEIAMPMRLIRTSAGPRGGPAEARNEGIRAASGAFIYLLDDDDAFLENRFSRSLPLFESGSCDLVLEPTRRVAPDGAAPPRVTGPYDAPQNAFRFLIEGGERSHVSPGATSFRKSLFERLGGYDSGLRFGEDGELLLRLCLAGRVALLEGEPVTEYFSHGSNTTTHLNLDYWQSLLALGVLYRKVRRQWPQEAAYLRDCLSAKLDFALSRIWHESETYGERIRRGWKCLGGFDWRCVSRRNLASIAVWLCRAHPVGAAGKGAH